METIKVALIDDQNLFRQSLALMIAAVPHFELVLQVAEASALMKGLSDVTKRPDVLLMDMNMPEMNGIELNEWMHLHHPEIRVIVLSVHAQDRLISKMIASGAAAYLIKNCEKEELLTAIKSTHETGFYMNKQVLHAVAQTARYNHKIPGILEGQAAMLTSREKEVLGLICKEFNSAEIAEALFLSVRTIEGHRNNLLLKTQSRNTAGLVLFAIRHALFEVL